MPFHPISSSNPLKKKAVAALRLVAGQPKAKVMNVMLGPEWHVHGDLMVKPAGGRGGKFTKLGTFTTILEF